MVEAKPIALFFPGQGAQHPGMGIDYYNHSSRAAKIFDRADFLAAKLDLGYKVTTLCFEDPNEELKGSNVNTAKIQPALLTVSMAIYEHLLDMGLVHPRYAAGHSAGKLIAAVASGALSFDAGFEMMVHRGEYMKNSKSSENGVVGVFDTAGKEVPDFNPDTGLMGIVNGVFHNLGDKAASFRVTVENSLTQVMFAGLRDEIGPVMEGLREIPHRIADIYENAPVSHSPLSADAQRGFNNFLESMRAQVNTLNFPLIDDRKGLLITTPAEFISSITDHIVDPISWRRTVMRAVDEGVTVGFEVGPGKILKGVSTRGTGLQLYTTGTLKEADLAKQNAPFAFI